MDFVGGNLDEFLHPEKHAAELAAQAGGSVAPVPEAPPAQPTVPPQVHYNPHMKFGPQPGQVPTFRLTIASPRLSVSAAARHGRLLAWPASILPQPTARLASLPLPPLTSSP